MTRLRPRGRWQPITMAIAGLAGALALVPGPATSAAQTTSGAECPDRESVGRDPDIVWTDVTPPPTADTRGGYDDIFFLDEQRGWAVGLGEIVFTVDGGLTWRIPAPSDIRDERGLPMSIAQVQFTYVEFADEQNGWVLATSHLGLPPPAPRNNITTYPSNTNDPWNPGLVLRTTDGGKTWEREVLPDLRTAVDAVTGEMVFQQERQVRLTGVSVAKDPPGHPAGTVAAWITADSESTDGTPTGDDGKRDRGLLFTTTTTTTSSADWRVREPRGPGGWSALLATPQFFGDRTGVAASSRYEGDGLHADKDGAVFATGDGGTNWTLVKSNPNKDKIGGNIGNFEGRLSFIDPTHGHALWARTGSGRKMYAVTPDGTGGRKWTEQDDCLVNTEALATVDGRNCVPPNQWGCNGLGVELFGPGLKLDMFTRTTGGGFPRDGKSTWVPSDNPRAGALTNVNLSYPSPNVAYAAGRLERRIIYKASINFVKITKVEVQNIDRAEGLLCGGTDVTITGDHFYPKDDENDLPASTVLFNGRKGDVIKVERHAETTAPDDKIIVRTPPAVAPGPVDVVVESPGREARPGRRAIPGIGSSFPAQGAFVYTDPGLAPPVIQSVTPRFGKLTGGDEVTIAGDRLGCAVRVDFRDRAGTSVRVPDKDFRLDRAKGEVTVKAPPWGASTSAVDVPVDVVVTTTGLAEVPAVPASPEADDYTYLGLPAIKGINPPRGPAFGGTAVTITGTGLEGATEVRFGNAPPRPVTAQSPTSITTTTPAHAVGAVPVTISTPKRGASLVSSAPQFTYHPGISGIFPPTGPTTGGTEVTIAGKGLAGTTEVRFGKDAVKFTERSDTELVAVAPPHAIPEAVPVSLVASDLPSLPEDVLFTYGLVTPDDPQPDDPEAGPAPRQGEPTVQPVPPGGSGSPAPGATPSLSSAPSPVPSGSPAPGGAGAAGASVAPGASPAPGASATQAPSSLNAPVGAAVPAPGPAPVAAPGAAGQGAPGSGQGAVGSDDNEEARGARRYAMTEASAGLALGGAGAAGCFSWLAFARRHARRRRASPAGRPRAKGAY